MLSERGFIDRVRGLAAAGGSKLQRSIGDDCAVFAPPAGHSLLVTTDTMVEGIHFDAGWHPFELLGRKAAAVNLSDIAAMGGSPLYALLSLAAPARTDEERLDRFMSGFLTVLSEHGTILIGGDTVRGEQLVFSVTLIGSAEPDRILYRSGAKAGDLLWVSGHLGEAAAGLELCRRGDDAGDRWPQLVRAHLDPQPQLDLGRFLAETGKVHAMMDLSDGLATDLAHLCKESGLGAEIEAGSLPLSQALVEAAVHLGRPAGELALTGGEDYGLLFATARAARESLPAQVKAATGIEIHCVGRTVAGPFGVWLLADGARRDISYQGYDHFAQEEQG